MTFQFNRKSNRLYGLILTEPGIGLTELTNKSKNISGEERRMILYDLIEAGLIVERPTETPNGVPKRIYFTTEYVEQGQELRANGPPPLIQAMVNLQLAKDRFAEGLAIVDAALSRLEQAHAAANELAEEVG